MVKDGHPEKLTLGPLEMLVGYRFRRAWAVLRKDFDRSVADLAVRQVQLGILSVVSANPGINQGVVGRMLDIQRANMVSLIGEMSEAGWVVRKVDMRDRRAIALSLSQGGEKLLEDALERIVLHEERLLAPLDAQDRKQLMESLRIIGDYDPRAEENQL